MKLALAALPEAERMYLLSARPTVLDWGCGKGDSTQDLAGISPGASVTGLEWSPGGAAAAHARHPDLEFVQSPEGRIPGSFDVVFATEPSVDAGDRLATVSSHLASCRMWYATVAPAIDSGRADNLPSRIGRFQRIESKTLPPDSDSPDGAPLLVIYASPEYLAMRPQWEATAEECRKWRDYYQGLNQPPPPEVVEVGDEFLRWIDQLLPHGGRVLEAGCGAGWQSLALARSGRYRVDLMDFSNVALDAARRGFAEAGLTAGFTLGDAFVEGKPEYDLVFNAGVVEHYSLVRQAQLLRGMASRSRKYVVCLAPNRSCYWYWISRVRNTVAGNWPFGKETPLIDFRQPFEAAGLSYSGRAYLGRAWTESFIRNLPGIADELRQVILQSHASPLIAPEQACHLVAGIGVVGGGEERDAVVDPATTTAELTSALADALALRIGAEAAAAKVLAQKAQSDAALADVREELRTAQSDLQALSAELASTRSKLARAHQLQRHGTQRQVGEVEQKLLATSADLNRARRTASASQVKVAQLLAGATRYSEALAYALEVYRGQRAWKLMLALRRAYTLLMREGWRGRKQFLFGPRKPLDSYDLSFPELYNYVAPPPVTATPEDAAALSLAARGGDHPPCRYDVVVLAIIDFDFRYQRPQQLAAQFARQGHRVFWVSATRVLPPNSSDSYRVVPIRQNIWEVQVRAPHCNLYGDALSADAVRGFAAGLSRMYHDWAVAETAIFVQLPFWRRLALQLRKEASSVMVYDCMDDWDTFENLGDFNRTEEVPLAEECEVLAVTAEKLREKFADRGLGAVLIRNGADFEFFRTAEPMGRLAGLRHPVIGYFGAIADWVDLDLIRDVARARPEYSFVMAGQVFGRDVSVLESLPNVSLLGPLPYEEMPSLLAAFDVCIIPFLLNQVTHATDPVKLYEYLSQGKPVVATDMSELRGCSGLIYLARDAGQFAAQLDAAVAEGDPALRAGRIEFARTNSWPARVAMFDTAIRDSLPKVSILIVTYNSEDFIAPCLRSVLECTSYPNFEVIVVDNNSSDQSPVIAERFRANDARVRVVRMATNRGFAGGNNAAAELATGDYVAFLNADVIATHGWLGYLLRHLLLDPSIGLICPVTNFAGNEAKINVDYSDEAGMISFAARIAREKRGSVLDVAAAPLFCAVMRRSLLRDVGGLDEGYQIGMFEDDDLAASVAESGFRICVAEDCFIHHFGQGSFSKLSAEEYQRIFETNRRRFEEKWRRGWIRHQTRPNVRPAFEEKRFVPARFCEVESQPERSGLELR